MKFIAKITFEDADGNKIYEDMNKDIVMEYKEEIPILYNYFKSFQMRIKKLRAQLEYDAKFERDQQKFNFD